MSTQKTVYLDHNATTPIADEIRDQLPRLLEAWGNPSSIHASSREPKQILRESRKAVAALLHCSPLELIFNSGGSEANTTVLRTVWEEIGARRPHFLISAVEHPSLMRTAGALEKKGARVDLIPVNRDGRLDLSFVRSKISDETALISVMAANNETGSLFPIKELANLAHRFGAYMHTDGVQMLGKLPVNLEEWDVDYASFSAHKFYALKGTGVLFVRKGRPHLPLVHGGGQERHRRGGTENTLGIAAMGLAASKGGLVEEKAIRVERLRDHFEARILKEIGNISLTAAGSSRLPNTSSLVVSGVDGETLLMNLDLRGFSVSTGAACSSGNPEPSPVLLKMGLTREEAQSSLRVSLGWGTTLDEIDSFVEVLKQVVFRLRSLDGAKSGVQSGS